MSNHYKTKNLAAIRQTIHLTFRPSFNHAEYMRLIRGLRRLAEVIRARTVAQHFRKQEMR